VEFVVDASAMNQRLDAFLSQQLSQFSRSHIRKAIDQGAATVDDQQAKASLKLKLDQRVHFVLPESAAEGPQAEPMDLDILHEDEAMVAVNKPPRMVVHPAKGHWSGTLASGLAHHFQSLSSVGGSHRPGIVHRLDRDTSGVILVAKTDEAHLKLSAQFAARTVKKRYTAFSRGTMDRDNEFVDQPIGPHPYQREKMAIREGHKTSRDARTEFEVTERYRGFVRFLAKPRTGRTHQIRVHLAHLGCPVTCDRLYAGHSRMTLGELKGKSADGEVILDRQALHASEITFEHPLSGVSTTIKAPLAPDLAQLETLLKEHRSL
jgi:23S rRNA pseudouridine1911/1915/1917 synthase